MLGTAPSPPPTHWGSPSESTQTVWCCPPEKPSQDLVEFLKDVRFCGEKQGSVPWVPAGRDAQTPARQEQGHGQAPALSRPPRGSPHSQPSSPSPSTEGLSISAQIHGLRAGN